MTFKELKNFLVSKMRMSHIYQPLLIKSLIESGGSVTIRQMAINFLAQDESQVLYYEKRLKEMPVKILSKHGIIKADGDLIKLSTDKLTFEQKAELKRICEDKMQNYIKSRGMSIWDYRLLDTELVPDSLRFKVLKDADGRCALCGATIRERPLDVDHIIPRSKGGKTCYENLQVLCSKCNRSKRDKDQTDFRNICSIEQDKSCVFCNLPKTREIMCSNNLAFAILDNYPVSKGHTLVIPNRHVADYFKLIEKEIAAINELLILRRKQLLQVDKTITGFNMGVNCGEAAGQTIFHCHVHLIPRRLNDTPNPKGGVRGVIPSKMQY
jgi:diadenosine tetraphosphate (Ap4A) HIT family hydrolase